ncbi:FtsW/RodA/SpoVE family cell cycle protein [Cohnella nanjingensis]|uniref:Rod shape-determining protein RodA n=1 Tax=Cohnella nanjingensis TaxID=1387779 RepID=A0A7X0RNE4_9BACL|nr:FtsW/RodA/SpoVE family cell cycle protein [Cohnella nanjingensis]MBB6670724.1 rod shape-determining protein RodA [Cohnella nanjingensis]
MNLFLPLKKLDGWTLIILAGLSAVGTFAVYQATSNTRLDGLHVSNLILLGAFCVPMLLVAMIDYRLLTGKITYLLYAIGIGMLVIVQTSGENINGAVRWLRFGQLQIQPSEMVKLFTILLICHLLQRRQGEKLRLWRDVVPICAVVAVPVLLIMKQPDLGTSLVFVGILLGMLWMGNIRTLYLLLFIGILTALISSIVYLYHSNYELLAKFVKPHQMARIQTFLDPASDPDKSWHVRNAISAVGSGQLYGDDGFYLKQGYIPYAYSDSVYVVIGEKYGFVGSAILLLLYYGLIYRMVIIIWEGRDLRGAYLIVGLISMMVFQIFVNIGMHIGLLPLTGISLPFISYGGSSQLTNMIAVGLALSVKMHKGEPVE